MENKEITKEEKAITKQIRRYSDIKPPKRVVKRKREGLYLPAYGKTESRHVLVEWSAIDNPLKALQVSRQISHKLWATHKTLADFLDLAFEHFGWEKGAPYL